MSKITFKIDREKVEAIHTSLNMETDSALQEIADKMLTDILKEMETLSMYYHFGIDVKAKHDDND